MRQRLGLTLQSIGDAVITTDGTGRVTWLIPVAERMAGRLQPLMSQQHLDHLDVDLLLQKMGGKAVAQDVGRHPLVQAHHHRLGRSAYRAGGLVHRP